jgi:DNA-binding transcriptional regulator YiaG
MTTEEIQAIQERLGLSDGKMALALGITRQTWRNWRRGQPCPQFARNALRWLMELRRLDPANDNIPDRIRHKP